MLDLLRDADEVHVLAAAGWTLDLQVIPVILVEPLQTLDEQEVDREPCSRRNDSGQTIQRTNGGCNESLHIGPLQLEFPPNIPDFDSPGQ